MTTPGRSIRLCLFLVVATIVTPRLARAGTDWAPIDPAELQMKDLPEQPGAPAFVLYHEQIDNDAMHFISVYMRIKVLTEAGRKYGDVQIPYDGDYETITGVHGRTIHVDGSVVELAGKPFDQVTAKGNGLKVKEKAFSLPDIQVGSIVEYRYVLNYDKRENNAAKWLMQNDMFQKKEHFQFSPDQFVTGEVGWAWNLPPGAEVKTKPHTFELDLGNVPAFVEEEHMPPARQFKYNVRFYYRREIDPDEFWKEAGKRWNSAVENFVGKKHGVADAVSNVVAASDTTEQKVKKIYAYVGGLENLSFKPQRTLQEKKVLGVKDSRGVDDVLRQKSGDRDEITALFVAMARAAGIPAYAMWVSDRTEDVFQKTYLSFDQFDAFIAIVEINGKEVFLDPGTKFCPYGLVDWKYTGTKGIRQMAGGRTEIAPTPPPDFTKAVTRRIARLQMNDHGEAEGKLMVIFMGQEALARRIEGFKTDEVGRTKLLEDEVKSWLPVNAEVSLTTPPQWNEVETPLVAEFKISAPVMISGGKRALLPTNVFEFNRPPMFAHPDRTQPIYFEYPSRQIDDVHIKLPDNLQVESLPANRDVKLEYALYRTARKQDKNEIDVTRDLAIASFYFNPTEYKNLKSFYDQVKEGDDEQALLKQVASAARN